MTYNHVYILVFLKYREIVTSSNLLEQPENILWVREP